MTKELQDYVWACLPKEFKEEVKKMYCTPGHRAEVYTLLQNLFGADNLTSDAEGEDEKLCVSRKKIQEVYRQNKEEINRDNVSSSDRDCYETVNEVLKTLFGSKCLQDDTKNDTKEPKPAEPKFNLGDIVRFKYCCTTYRIDGFKMSDGVMLYQVGEVWAEESDLEPYTGPEENIAETRNFSQDCDKQFDNILKDSFSKERRLNIAAQMMQGLICAPIVPGVDPNLPAEYLAQTAFRLADALIAEAGLNDKLKGE